MARNTRTFSDIDLNFGASPIGSQTTSGIGTISCSTSSPTVTGVGTYFDDQYVSRTLYVGTTLIGRVKSVTSATSLVLYANANSAYTNQSFSWTEGGDVVRKYDDNAIKASVRNLVLTSNFERPFHSEIGCQLRNLLFEPATPLTILRIQQTIAQTITNFEPRVNLVDVTARLSPDNNSVYVSIEYRIVNTQTPQVVNLILERTR